MTKPPLLLYGPMMAARRAAWEEDYTVSVLTDADETLLQPLASEVRVVACGENLPDRLIDALPSLGLVACFSTGYAGIDVSHLRERGIALTTGGGVNAHDVADHAIALLLARWHRIGDADRKVRNGEWRATQDARPSLRGRRAGVIGLGRIGSAIATRLAAHELDVSWWGPRLKPGAPFPRAESLIELAERSDVLIVASRADPANRHQVDRDILRALGPRGVLVNVSRGLLVDEDALIGVLKAGELGGAALDVFEDEPTPPARWDGVPNLVLTPHIAGFTQEAGEDLRRQQHENVRRFLAGEPLLMPVLEAS